MRVLFLDIDGVVNRASTRQTHLGYVGIDPTLASIVRLIQRKTGCELVLSSTWRNVHMGRHEVERRVARTYDVTPTSPDGFRGDEINAWLEKHPEVTRYAIVDDNTDFHDGQPLFRTNWETGITREIADQITEYLNHEQQS